MRLSILPYTFAWIVKSDEVCRIGGVQGNMLLQKSFTTQSRHAAASLANVVQDPEEERAQGNTSAREKISALQQRESKLPDKCSHHSASSLTMLPMNQRCALGCPFSQQLPGDKCHKVCVAEIDCATFHPGRGFADQATRECVPSCGPLPEDKVMGCTRCAGVGQCAECMTGFRLAANGRKCQSMLEGQLPEGVWPIIYTILSIAVVILLCYLVSLSRRPEINSEVCERSLQFREHCKSWYLEDDMTWHRYPGWTDVAKTDISGQGVILYFRRLKFAIGVALLLVVSTYITYTLLSVKMYADTGQSECKTLSGAEAAEAIIKQAEIKQAAIASDNQRMFISMVISYVVLLVASFIFEYNQVKLSEEIDDLNATHEDYAVLASGLPKDCTDPNELTQYFQKVVDNAETRRGLCSSGKHRIVGCSIAYDYKQHEEMINNAICDWVEELECEHGRKQPSSQPKQSTEPGCSCSVTGFEFLDCIFWGSCTDESPEKVQQEQIRDVLKGLQGSGYCYVIMEDAATVDSLKEQMTLGPPKFRGKYQIQLSNVASEPPDLYWENFTDGNFWIRITLGICLIALTLGVWIMLYMTYASCTGASAGFLEGTLLGMVITIGNAIVASVIDSVTRWAGFMQKDRRDIAILSLALLSTLLNTVFDLWMALRIAKGVTAVDNADGESSQGFDLVVAEEIFAMIIPGYLILPFLATPLIEHVVPYWLGLWLVRSRKASPRAGEECLKCPEFDICWRYSDLANNFTVCTMMLFMVSPHSYQVMMWLVGSIALIYMIDKYKLLRQTSQTYYTTRRLSDAASLWWCAPTGAFAAVTASWACRAGVLPAKSSRWACLLAFFVNCAVWIYLYRKAHRMACSSEILDTTAYHKMCDKLQHEGMMWSYFNTNPIYCLRSKYLGLKELGSSTFPCVPYVPGKQHLQPGAPSHFVMREASKYKTGRVKG